MNELTVQTCIEKQNYCIVIEMKKNGHGGEEEEIEVAVYDERVCWLIHTMKTQHHTITRHTHTHSKKKIHTRESSVKKKENDEMENMDTIYQKKIKKRIKTGLCVLWCSILGWC